MKHFIQYHKSWEEGNPLSNPQPYVFTKLNSMKESIVVDAWENGGRVWLIHRTDPNSSDYYIAYTFEVADVDVSDKHLEMFGEEGSIKVFNPPIVLSKTKQKWFSDFLKKNGNFAFGFKSLQSEFEKEFDDFLAKSPAVTV
ncbi:hypothetical protein [Psychromonas sp. L1A2]|uniref:hypothetical protein n=1 Tax=Psychromonas sp. L1A2 TaxID=2686356 RepID=UPI00135C76FC|nr:hypothetical protein [Psychromonas sp. L1A2]